MTCQEQTFCMSTRIMISCLTFIQIAFVLCNKLNERDSDAHHFPEFKMPKNDGELARENRILIAVSNR